jgi:hypothetical protein
MRGLWRTDRDSNPGYLAVYTLSKRAPSATRPSVRSNAGQPSNFTTMGRQEGLGRSALGPIGSEVRLVMMALVDLGRRRCPTS